MRDGDQRVCVAALESPHGLRTIVPLGACLPLDIGSAGRLLAEADGAGPPPSGPGWVASVGEREAGVASVSAPGARRRGRASWPRSACRARSSAPPASRGAATAPPWSPPPVGWSGTPGCDKSEGVSERPLAAIDIGTNSFHLVVARVGDVEGGDGPAGPAFEVIAREKEMVRLGSGSGDMKLLAPDAIERGVAALERLARIAEVHDADIHAVATSAVREAENAEEFLDRARDEAGVEVEVISGVEEARLIHLGVLQAVPVFDQRLVLVDIGGGSTEILVGEKGETLAAGSLKLGAIRLTRRFFRGDRLHPGAVECLPAPRPLRPGAHGARGRALRLRRGGRLVGHRGDGGRDGPGPTRAASRCAPTTTS